jgi:hypothetical protein
MIKRLMQLPIDWLLAIIFSCTIPLEFFGNTSTYFKSLFFWLVPVILLLPRLYHETDKGGRRRRAFWLTVAFIFLSGCFLDFILGQWILAFDPAQGVYIYRIPSWGQGVPIEEVFFYLLGGMAIVLVYFWADEYWMKAYNVRQRRWNDELFGGDFKLVQISKTAIILTIALFVAGLIVKAQLGHGAWPPPYYYTFLVLAALVPAVIIYRGVNDLVNWRAFSFTCLYVLVTSCVWEVTLGIARKWWWYQGPPAVMGWYIPAFGHPERPYPMEALVVWLVVSFDTILAYEFIKALIHDRRSVRETLFGGTSTLTPPLATSDAH